MTLSAFKYEVGHRLMTSFALLWPPPFKPEHMLTLMVIAQASCDRLDPLLPIVFPLFLVLLGSPLSCRLVGFRIACVNLSGTLVETVLLPVFTTTSLPTGTTEVTKFEPTPTTVIDGKLR